MVIENAENRWVNPMEIIDSECEENAGIQYGSQEECINGLFELISSGRFSVKSIRLLTGNRKKYSAGGMVTIPSNISARQLNKLCGYMDSIRLDCDCSAKEGEAHISVDFGKRIVSVKGDGAETIKCEGSEIAATATDIVGEAPEEIVAEPEVDAEAAVEAEPEQETKPTPIPQTSHTKKNKKKNRRNHKRQGRL